MLKRSIVLAALVVLFIAAFIIYFEVAHKELEDRFQAERVKYGVQGMVLTSATPPEVPMPAPVSAPDTNTLIGPVPPAASTPDASATPAATPDASSTPATPSTPDSSATPSMPSTPDTSSAPSLQSTPDLSNPTAPSMPDTNATPAPSAPDMNATPAAPAPTPSSTMNAPRESRAPFFQLASYRPDEDAPTQLANALPGATTETVTPATTNAPAPVAAPVTAPALAPIATPAPKSEAAGEGSVIVLLYHQFKPAGVAIPSKFQWTMNQDVFASEMKYIHDNGYNVISMDQLIKFIKHEGTVPPRAVCITIDDGYKSAVVYAAPILKQYGYPWTFFIYPDFVTVAEGSGAVSWNDLIELQKEGIDIECHSMTHPILKSKHQKVKGVWHNFSPDEYAAWLNNETAGAKAILEQHLGKPVTRFAYPYGEYNTQVEDAVIAAGFEDIFTVADNPVHATTSLHSIGRYTITQGVEKDFAAYLRQGALGLSDADPAPGATTSNPRPIITATLGYPGTLDPKSIETSVRDFGDVRHDFDPATNTIRLYLPRDLIASVVLVNIRVQDAQTKQVMVANWHFNYEPAGSAIPPHAPIATPTSAPAPAPTTTETSTPAAPVTNAPAVTAPEPLEKNAPGTPLDAHPAPAPTPAPAAQKAVD